MENKNRKYYLLNYIFLPGVLLLFLNDHYFKWVYTSWLTGKLSDLTGILILPFLLTFLFPNRLRANLLLTGIFFVFWKSPYAEGLINWYNQYAIIPMTRVVDYTDLIALLMLVPAYLGLRSLRVSEDLYLKRLKLHPLLVLIPSLLVLLATSPPPSFYWTYSQGDLTCYNCTVKLRMNTETILEKMRAQGMDIRQDTLPKDAARRLLLLNPEIKDTVNLPFYRIDEIIIEQDTIRNFQFALRKLSNKKTKIYLNGMDVSEEIPDYEVAKTLRRYYYRLLKAYTLDMTGD